MPKLSISFILDHLFCFMKQLFNACFLKDYSKSVLYHHVRRAIIACPVVSPRHATQAAEFIDHALEYHSTPLRPAETIAGRFRVSLGSSGERASGSALIMGGGGRRSLRGAARRRCGDVCATMLDHRAYTGAPNRSHRSHAYTRIYTRMHVRRNSL